MVDLGQGSQSTFHRIACAARWILDNGDDAVREFKPTGEIGGLRPDDEDPNVRSRALPSPQNTLNHGNTGHRVQWFRNQ